MILLKFLFIAVLFVSVRAHAAYICTFNISSTNDLNSIISQKKILASKDDFKSYDIQDFVVESEKTNEKQSITLKTIVVGWKGEEEINFEVHRSTQKISDKVSLRGNNKDTLWFDSYKLDAECAII